MAFPARKAGQRGGFVCLCVCACVLSRYGSVRAKESEGVGMGSREDRYSGAPSMKE